MKTLRPHQTKGIDLLRAGFGQGHRRGLLVIPTGGGKCLGRGTPVMLHDGRVKAVEDVVVGDRLMGPDSGPRVVMSLARGREMLYRVTPVKGDSYVVNESHILSLKLTPASAGEAAKVVNVTVLEYLAASAFFRHRAKGWRAAVEWPARDVPVDPYFLGLWLGDGTAAHTHVSKPDPEVAETVTAVARRWVMRARRQDSGSCPTLCIYRGQWGNTPYVNPLKGAMRGLGLMPDKFVPDLYRVNSTAVRLAVLAGILDADGCLGHGGFDFISIFRRLAEDVVFLARSVGLAAYLTPCRKGCQTGAVGDYFRVSISGDCSRIPTRIPRKKAGPRRQVKDVLVTGIKVEPVGEGGYFGFEVSGADRLFLLGDFTVTHNTVAAVHMLRQMVAKGKRGLFVADRRVLVGQAARVFREEGLPAGVLMADAEWGWHDPAAPVQVCSKDTLVSWSRTRAGFEMPPADLVVLDECHRTSGPSWEVLRGRYGRAYEVGLTATPAVGDKGMGDLYDFLAQPVTYAELQAMGVLVRPACFAPGRKVTGKAGRKPTRDGLVGDAVFWWKTHAEGLRTFLFASDVAHSLALRDEFRAAGIPAEHVDAGTSDEERRDVLNRLVSRETLVVTNVDILRYGVDVPAVECCQLMAPMASLTAYRQSAGRVLRADPANPAKRAVVIDHAGATLYHGLPDADIDWPLDAGADCTARNHERLTAGGEEAQSRQCPKCQCLFRGRPDCPGCGHKAERKAKSRATKVGTLVEVDRGERRPLTQDELNRVWRRALGWAANTGKRVSMAAVLFHKEVQRWPEQAGVTPLPSRADHTRLARNVFPEMVRQAAG